MSCLFNHVLVLLIVSTCAASISATRRSGACPNYRTGVRASYDLSREVCCGGRVFPADRDARTLCCGDRTYQPRREICCGGEVRRRSEGHKCCSFRTWYDPLTELCCGNRVKPNLLGLSKCCGSVAYNTEEQTCCPLEAEDDYGRGRLTVLDGIGQCCGNTVIDPTQQICCNGVALERTSGFTECCGNTTYSAMSEGCCGDRTPYDLRSQRCCDGTVHSAENGAKCCGARYYHSADASCCHENVFRGIPEVPGVQSCCGGVSYSKTSQLCCEGTLYDRGQNIECCGDVTYNTSSELCCGFGDQSAVLHLKSTPAERCCGVSTYDPTSQTCCEAASRSFDLVGGQCCGTDPLRVRAFDPNRGTCCRGFTGENLYHDAPTNQSRCCGSVLMSENELCNPMEEFPIRKRAANDTAICYTSDMMHITTYDSETQICLEDGSIEYYSPTVDVCGNLLYDPTAEICCEGLIRGRFDEEGYERACCTGTTNSFTPDLQTCCYGNIHDVPTARARCCRTKAYDQSTHVCDDSGLVRSLEDFNRKPKLCDHTPYDPQEHSCCGGLLIRGDQYCCMGFHAVSYGHIEGGLCCGLGVYDPRSQVCCDGTIYSKQGSEISCCGSHLLSDPKQEICCDSTLHSRNHGRNSCDGHTAFNPDAETVCGGILYSVPHGRCCGGQAYDDAVQICCNGLLHTRTSETEECCGTMLYDSTDVTTVCCNGQLNRGPAGLVCCGDAIIDPLTQTCCQNYEFPFALPRLAEPSLSPLSCCDPNTYDSHSSPHTCCGGVEQRYIANGECCGQDIIRSPDEEICCSGKVVSRIYGEHTGCCDGHLIDDRELTCCGNRIVIPGGFEQCCGSTVVNTLYQTCCGEEIYRTTERTGCCAGKMFSIDRQGCCGISLYDLTTQECSDSNTVTPLQPGRRLDNRCDDQELDISEDDNFASNPRSDADARKTACCSGRRYNPTKFDCCNGTLHDKIEGAECCGTAYFNPTKEVCCNDQTVVSTLHGETCVDNRETRPAENTDLNAPQCICTNHSRSRDMSSTCLESVRNRRNIFIGIVIDDFRAVSSERQDCGQRGSRPCPSRYNIQPKTVLRGRLPSTPTGDGFTQDDTVHVVTSEEIGCQLPIFKHGHMTVVFTDHRAGPGGAELQLGRNDVIISYNRKVSRSLRDVVNRK